MIDFMSVCHQRVKTVLIFLFKCSVLSAATITSSKAREAVLKHVSTKSCYSKDPAQDVTIHDIKLSSAYHVSQIEQKQEKRKSSQF